MGSRDEYNRKHYRQFNFRLNKEKDAAIISFLESLESLPEYIRGSVSKSIVCREVFMHGRNRAIIKTDEEDNLE